MRLWQRAMISLARSDTLKGFMQRRRAASRLALRFVGGESAVAAVGKSEELKSRGRVTSLFCLGEYVEELSVIDETVSKLKAAIHLLSDAKLDVHLSVDPTQIGYQIDARMCRDNAFEIAASIRRVSGNGANSRNILTLDMEDSSVTEATLKLYGEMRAAQLPVAVTLQAYLERSEKDLDEIVTHGGSVRLVKGAFAERGAGVIRKRTAVDENYLKLASAMLSAEARARGFYPVFGTHDRRLVEEIIRIASAAGWEKDRYEFEMLYGVGVDLQDRLVHAGEHLRLYLPFGRDWWPYAARRIGESPRNAMLVLRSIAAV